MRAVVRRDKRLICDEIEELEPAEGQLLVRTIFECVGAPGVLRRLIEAAPAGAQIVVAGVCMESDTPEEFAGTLRNIAEGVIDVSGLVTAKVGLDGVADAFVALGDPEAQLKILVEPGR
jgi:threonine dehydrogenase-like Zn-dependent dehydrogenase